VSTSHTHKNKKKKKKKKEQRYSPPHRILSCNKNIQNNAKAVHVTGVGIPEKKKEKK
jgi:hypothetical protein